MYIVMISSPLNESGITHFFENRKKGFNVGHAGHVLFAGGSGGAHRKGAGGGVHEKGGGRGKGKGGGQGRQGRCGNGTNEEGGCSVAAASGDGSSAKASDGGTSEVSSYRYGKKGHWRGDGTAELCSRYHGPGHATDVCPTSREDAVLAASDDDDDYDAVEVSAFKDGDISERRNVSGRRGKESQLGRQRIRPGFAIVECLLT